MFIVENHEIEQLRQRLQDQSAQIERLVTQVEIRDVQIISLEKEAKELRECVERKQREEDVRGVQEALARAQYD